MFRYLLLFTLLLSSFIYANAKGLKLVYTDNGQEITRYEGSYALLVGVSDYTNGWPDLEAVPSELKKVKESLIKKGFVVKMVMNPDSRELENAYESFIDRYGYDKNNRLLFFYSGHGYSTNNGKKGYLVPSDAPNPNRNMRDFKRKSLKMSRLLSLSREMEANHALFLFDSCFSGTIFKTRALPKVPPYIQKSMARPVRQFITAGGAGEEVPAKSVFAPLFIDAINGKADLNRDGYITGSEVGMYLSTNVPIYKRQNPQYGKIRDYELSRGDFIFLSPSKKSNTKPSNYTFTTVAPKKFSLTVIPTPSDARVQITNIKPKYHDGIRLKRGTYTVKVSKEGYLTKKGKITLSGDLAVPVVLEREKQYHAPAPSYSGSAFRSTAKDHGSYIEPAMVRIKAGSFMMGSDSGDSDEKPVHRVTIENDFYMGKYEVTIGEYLKCVSAGGCPQPEWLEKGSKYNIHTGSDNYYKKMCLQEHCPIIGVSWSNAKSYAKWLSQKTGQRYRLPTEAEWEYAARAGTTTKYSFGDSKSDLGRDGWYGGNSNGTTHQVGGKRANPWGLYDMHGNVWEWCEDWYSDNYKQTPRNGGANRIGEKKKKVLRGGSWYSGPSGLRSAYRSRNVPYGRDYGYGFRLSGTLP